MCALLILTLRISMRPAIQRLFESILWKVRMRDIVVFPHGVVFISVEIWESVKSSPIMQLNANLSIFSGHHVSD